MSFEFQLKCQEGADFIKLEKAVLFHDSLVFGVTGCLAGEKSIYPTSFFLFGSSSLAPADLELAM